MTDSNTFEDLRKYKEENNLCTKKDLIKIWQTQKPNFWIKDQNVPYEEYYVGKKLISLFKMTDVNKVKEFLDDLASKSNTRQSAYQSYIMFKTTGYSWATKKPSAKKKLKEGKDKMLEKMKKTNLEKYGVEFVSQTQEVKDKQKETFIEKYGEDYAFKFSKKGKENILKRDGDFSILRNGYRKRHKQYSWNGETFDSKWEIYYWQWLKDNSIEFDFQPKPINYFFNGKRHEYNPDFKIGNEYIEVKNDSLLKEMINSSGKEHAKYLCMLENNVKILLQKDIYPYQKYFKQHYNESEIIELRKSHRNHNPNGNIKYFEFKCLETNKTYNTIDDIDELIKDCGIKSKSKTFIRESVKKCCDGEKKYYLHYHFEYA